MLIYHHTRTQGFLLLVFAILLVTCAEITVVLTYFQVCMDMNMQSLIGGC